MGFSNEGVEKGVSEKLAAYRRQTLTRIKYDLALQIPARKQQTILASETITVVVLKNEVPLQVDFKEQADYVKSVTVNQIKVPVVFTNEHIIIDPKFLVVGQIQSTSVSLPATCR